MPRRARKTRGGRVPRHASTVTPPAAWTEADNSLLDVIDNLLNQGVVINGELILSIADVDLIYLRLSTLLCAADRVVPQHPDSSERTHEALTGRR